MEMTLVDVLANWLWQGSAVALAATLILRASSRMSATTRYHLWWVTLVVVLTLPAFSFQLPAASFQQDVPHVEAGDPAPHALEAGSWEREAGTGPLRLPTFPVWTPALLVLMWFAWASVSFARTLRGCVTLRQAKRAARPFPAAREARLETWLSLRVQGRRAALGVSDRVRAAAVLGLTSPAIVVAPSALTTLTDRELDQIVVHEWAHVQRRDDFARLVQRFVVALAGLHPAVWWIERQLNLERETACDDWAINATGSARGLAVCLTKLAAMPGRPADAVLLPAALLSSELTTRVVRLLDRSRNTSTTRRVGAPLVVAPILAAIALVVASVELVVTSPRASEAHSTAPPHPSTVVEAEETPVPKRVVAVPAAAPGIRNAGATRAARPRVAPPAPAPPSALHETTPAHASTVLAEATNGADPFLLRPAVESPLGADLPGISVPAALDVTSAAPAAHGTPEAAPPVPGATLWGAAADAGVTVGKGSHKAAAATAGFFTRLSKSITGVF